MELGCHHRDWPAPLGNAPGQFLFLSEVGQTVCAYRDQKGQILTIKLEANPTTGYSWELVESEGAILEQVGEPDFEADSDLLGAPGTQTLRFEAVEAGQMELRLVYRPAWEEGVEPVETFTVQVTVQ